MPGRNVILARLAFEVYVKNRIATQGLMREYVTHTGVPVADARRKRVHFYTAQSRLTNCWFGLLRGFPPNRNEKSIALYLGALTPLLDDLADQDNSDLPTIEAALQGEGSKSLVSYLYQRLSEVAPPALPGILDQTLAVQDESRRQRAKDEIPRDELIELTANKGGYAVWLYRHMLGHPTVQGEREALFELGFLLQLVNDLFSLYRDLEEGQQTLVTRCRDWQALDDLFSRSWEQTKAAYRALGYKREDIHAFLTAVSLVAGRGRVCLDQLGQYQNRLAGHGWQGLGREQLVCDMETWNNLRASLRFG